MTQNGIIATALVLIFLAMTRKVWLSWASNLWAALGGASGPGGLPPIHRDPRAIAFAAVGVAVLVAIAIWGLKGLAVLDWLIPLLIVLGVVAAIGSTFKKKEWGEPLRVLAFAGMAVAVAVGIYANYWDVPFSRGAVSTSATAPLVAPPTSFPCQDASMDHTSRCMLDEKSWALIRPDRAYDEKWTFCGDTGNGNPPPREYRDGNTRGYRSPPGHGSLLLLYRLVPGRPEPGRCKKLSSSFKPAALDARRFPFRSAGREWPGGACLGPSQD